MSMWRHCELERAKARCAPSEECKRSAHFLTDETTNTEKHRDLIHTVFSVAGVYCIRQSSRARQKGQTRRLCVLTLPHSSSSAHLLERVSGLDWQQIIFAWVLRSCLFTVPKAKTWSPVATVHHPSEGGPAMHRMLALQRSMHPHRRHRRHRRLPQDRHRTKVGQVLSIGPGLAAHGGIRIRRRRPRHRRRNLLGKLGR